MTGCSSVSRCAMIVAAAIASFSSLGVQDAAAQEATQSAGCAAANAGDFDFSLPTSSPLTQSMFSDVFTLGDVLTFTLSAGGGAVVDALAEDVTGDVTIIDGGAETSVDYTVPASGARDFNLELETTGDFAGEISVTCSPAENSITIVKASDVSGDFNFAGDLGNFSIAVNGEPGSAFFTGIAAGAYRISEILDPEFEVASIQCVGDTDGGSTVDVANGEVLIDLDDGEAIQCTFTNAASAGAGPSTPEEIVEVSQHAIRNFLYRRANLLLAEEPDRTRIIRKNPGLVSGDGVDLNIQADGDSVDASFALSAGDAWGNRFDIWTEGRYASYKTNNGADAEGDFGVVYFGVDYLLTDGLLIGVLGQTDWVSDSSAMGESIDGNGWMAGPYLSAQLDQNIFFDARAAWGHSNNDLTIDGSAIDDEFETSRWLIRGALTGNRRFGDWRITPTASVSYLEERQEDYLSGTGVAVGGQTVALGRATFEPEIAYRHVTRSGVLIEPQVTLAGVWDFETPEGLSIPGWEVTTDDLRMRVEGGLMAVLTNGFAVRVAGSYDGIGADGYEAYGARVWLDIPIGRAAKKRKPRPAAPAPALKACADGTLVPATDSCLSAPEDIAVEIAFKDGKPALSDEGYAALSEAWAEASGYDVLSIVIEPGSSDTTLAARRIDAIRAALESLGAPTEAVRITEPQGAGEETMSVLFQLQ